VLGFKQSSTPFLFQAHASFAFICTVLGFEQSSAPFLFQAHASFAFICTVLGFEQSSAPFLFQAHASFAFICTVLGFEQSSAPFLFQAHASFAFICILPFCAFTCTLPCLYHSLPLAIYHGHHIHFSSLLDFPCPTRHTGMHFGYCEIPSHMSSPPITQTMACRSRSTWLILH